MQNLSKCFEEMGDFNFTVKFHYILTLKQHQLMVYIYFTTDAPLC